MAPQVEIEFQKDFDLGKYLRDQRKSMHLTQADLAERTGLSVMSIRRYESGQRAPGFEEMIKLGKELGFVIGVDAKFENGNGNLITEGEINHIRSIQDFQSRISELSVTHSTADKILAEMMKLNSKGKEKALEFISMLTHVPEYTNSEEDKDGES